MENKEIKIIRPYAHDCNECKPCQYSIKYKRANECSACHFIFFEKLYKNLSSGNKLVDEIIKNPIYIPSNNSKKDNDRLNYYSWIPWESLSNIEEIARGGFGVIYKATITDGLIDEYSIKHHGLMEYERWGVGMEVAIKIIKTNSEEVFQELNIQRSIAIMGEKLDYISSMYGITQSAETLEYGIVMEFAKHGDMRRYLSTNFHSTNWSHKLFIAWHIAIALANIHSCGLVHRDLHSGNILQLDQQLVQIGDLGLCQPINNGATTEEKKEIFGVIPYIPPEVLKGQKFTSAGDIYSFSMLLWELATGRPPFHDRSHDNTLIFNIISKGIRPEITTPLIPPCIAELIEKCWDVNPENRPTAEEVKEKLGNLRQMHMMYTEKSKTQSPEIAQFLESDNYIKEMLKNDVTTNYLTDTATITIHPGSIYTSRVLSLQIFDETNG
ncbi:hypothetical protein G9A89_005372 [Geosiphon pyriformis]|nr:hypothetical protein G9A89_005372 [Geosiphon pyriformis]